MRRVALCLMASVWSVSPALTEQVTLLPEIVIGSDAAQAPAKPEDGAGVRPQVVIGGGQGHAPAGPDGCVEPRSSSAMHCLNRRLKGEVDRVNPVANLPPIDARSSDLKTGVVNIPAVRQQYGRNFGVSVIPYRPPPPTFTMPHR